MECDSPISLKFDPPRIIDGQLQYYFPSGCGKCLPCLLKRKAQWSLRLVNELQESFSAYFVTLTYDDDHLPWGEEKPTGNKGDHKHFIKWLQYYEKTKTLKRRNYVSQEELERKRNKTVLLNEKGSRKRLKYYGVIEYGTRYSRPHLHYILFNVVDIDNLYRAWSKQAKIARGYYKPLEKFGRIQIDECNVNTIDYVLKYMVKPQSDKDFDQKEVSFMSKGLGERLATDEIIRHIKKEDGNALLNSRGSKVGVPRYFIKKHLTDKEREQKAAFISKQKDAKEVWNLKNSERQGINPFAVQVMAIKSRYNNLLSTKKRKLE